MLLKNNLLLLLLICSSAVSAQKIADTSQLRADYNSLLSQSVIARNDAKGKNQTDSIRLINKADSLSRLANSKKHILDSLITSIGQNKGKAVPATTGTKDSAKNDSGCNCVPNQHAEDIGVPGWILVFTPLIILLLAVWATWSGLKNFNIKDALSENNGTKVTIENPLYNAVNMGLPPTATGPNPATLSVLVPPTIDVTPFTSTPNPAGPAFPPIRTPNPEYRPSISRFIALFSVLVIIAVTTSMSCLFIYRYIAYGCPPDFSTLTGILLALGIGIVPYSVNKAANAASDK